MPVFPDYDEPLFRPPSEAEALILQVTIGCSNNTCTFCEMYATKRFRTRPIEEIVRDIEAARCLWPHPKKIFLADGDAMALSASRLVEVCALLRVAFGGGPRISAYAAPGNILAKTDEDLGAIRAAGLALAYVGVESGSDAVLARVQKGATAAEIEASIVRLNRAGIATSVTWILGLGGRCLSEEHARETAALLSRCAPTYVSALTLMLPCGPERLLRHFPEWEPIDPRETLLELRQFAEAYSGPPTIFRSNHASNYLPLKAVLPEEKGRLIAVIDEAMAHPEEALRPEWMRGL